MDGIVPTTQQNAHHHPTLLPYLRRQAATVGRSLPASTSPAGVLWVPENLPHRENDCLGILAYEDQDTSPSSVVMGKDGKTLFAGNDKGEVRAWDLKTGKSPWRQKKAHTAMVRHLSLSPDGRILASASQDYIISLWNTRSENADNLHHLKMPCDWEMQFEAKWSPSGQWLASTSDETITLWNPLTGQRLHDLQEHRNPRRLLEWSPDSKILASSENENILYWNPESGEYLEHWAAPDDVMDLAWSPDGGLLASSHKNRTISLWDAQTKKQLHLLNNDDLKGIPLLTLTLAWSPEGQILATSYTRNIIALWNASTGKCLHHWETGSTSASRTIAWSPNGEILAALLSNDIALWSAETGAELTRFALPHRKSSDTSYLTWSSDGAFLVSSYDHSRFAVWDTRRFLTEATTIEANIAEEPQDGKRLSRSLSQLPLALTQLHKLKIYPSLNLLQDVLQLLGGQKPATLAALAIPLAPLIQLKWPPNARIGLAALLLRGYHADPEWMPPAVPLTQLHQQLAYALSGGEVPAQPAPVPVSQLQEQTQIISETFINLLQLLGAEAVAKDPSLPLYLARQLPRIKVNIPLNRRLLNLSYNLRSSGHAQQKLSSGERTDLSIRGDLPHLLPSQLLLPPKVLNNRYLRNELLYRVYSGKEEPPLRPTLIVLDVSPPCFGPVEKLTRQAAYILANTLYKAQKPVMLLAAGGQNSFVPIEKPADLLEVWVRRSLQPVQIGLTLQTARALAATLQEDDVKPLVMLLTHTYFGMEENIAAEIPHLRGLFVRHPQTSVPPAWGKHCERWEVMDDTALDRLPATLMYLLE